VGGGGTFPSFLFFFCGLSNLRDGGVLSRPVIFRWSCGYSLSSLADFAWLFSFFGLVVWSFLPLIGDRWSQLFILTFPPCCLFFLVCPIVSINFSQIHLTPQACHHAQLFLSSRLPYVPHSPLPSPYPRFNTRLAPISRFLPPPPTSPPFTLQSRIGSSLPAPPPSILHNHHLAVPRSSSCFLPLATSPRPPGPTISPLC